MAPQAVTEILPREPQHPIIDSTSESSSPLSESSNNDSSASEQSSIPPVTPISFPILPSSHTPPQVLSAIPPNFQDFLRPATFLKPQPWFKKNTKAVSPTTNSNTTATVVSGLPPPEDPISEEDVIPESSPSTENLTLITLVPTRQDTKMAMA